MSIDLDDIKEIVSSHMDNQPYNITCSECGASLEYTKSIDGCFDLDIEIRPCDCVTPDTV